MSNPLLDISIAVTVAALAVLGSMVVLPRWKPEPPPPVERACDPQKEQCPVPVAVKRAVPMTDAQRLDALSKKADDVSEEQRQLIEEVKQLTVEVRKKND